MFFFVYIRLANFHILLCKKMHNNQQMKCDSANPIYSYYHLLTDIDIINAITKLNAKNYNKFFNKRL